LIAVAGVSGCLEFNAVSSLLMLGRLRTLLRLSVAGLLVDVDFLAVLRRLLGTAKTLFLVDADLLLDVGVAVGGSVDGG
jgi:hypothetical protein